MKSYPSSFDIRADVKQLILRSCVDIETFRGSTILITGGTGFFGIWLLSALIDIKQNLGGDFRILALSRTPNKFLEAHPQTNFESQIEFVAGDVKTFVLKGVNVTHLVHMAATNAAETFAGEEQIRKLELLYLGTRNVLEQCGASLENVLFTSSGVAYGKNKKSLMCEDDLTCPDPTDVNSALGIGKLAAEYLISYYAKKLSYSYSIARCFAFAGQYLPLNLHYAFGNFIWNSIEEIDIVIRGDGKDMRSYMYIGDAVAWMLRLLAEPKNEIFNVGSEKPISMEALATKIASMSQVPIGVSILNKHLEIGNFRRGSYIPSTSKIKTANPGLVEWTTLEEIILKMINTSSRPTSA